MGHMINRRGAAVPRPVGQGGGRALVVRGGGKCLSRHTSSAFLPTLSREASP